MGFVFKFLLTAFFIGEAIYLISNWAAARAERK
ncbi:unnamed protein product [Tuber melanosporum]|uniref:(Perigord truffle) hypothetical protein n=1 Tax=Tuber melanosporum (strain Mel28) TaxID=656061 RepID=D5GI85_TUBMM|nr:uncharacterized protein GSTUM_00008331001 [Tuber melanosporum]CAZ84228.1 unnamed protein product [Tuber melanosporum]